MSRAARGPLGLPLTGHLLLARRDPLGLLERAARLDEPVTRLRLGPVEVLLVQHPDGVRRVLQENAANYDKQTRSTGILARITGESVLTTNGEAWRARRRTLSPLLHRASVEQMRADMEAETVSWCGEWAEAAARGTPLDAWSACRRLALAVVARTLFGVVPGDAGRALACAVDDLLRGALSAWLTLPAWVPSPRRRRFDAAIRAAAGTTRGLLLRALESGAPGPLLRLLSGEDSVGPDAADALLPECITFLLAGHDTTACGLAWALHELSRRPKLAETIRAELASGDESGLDLFWREVLRLHPPIWIVERRAVAADEIGGVRIPAGSSVLVSPYQLHRHPRWWERPEEFDPERFRTRPPAGLWIPFGLGSRYCIGAEFAGMEARLALRALLAGFTFTAARADPVRPAPALTLTPDDPLPLHVRKR